jgi:hypothetical protein
MTTGKLYSEWLWTFVFLFSMDLIIAHPVQGPLISVGWNSTEMEIEKNYTRAE